MFSVKKSINNPLLEPDTNEPWQAEAVFNWCPVQDKKVTRFVYRAMSAREFSYNVNLSVSTIGYAETKDYINFTDRRQIIFPEYEWEKFGCEDPRMVKIGKKYYIFYTALSNHPFDANSIKVALAITEDFQHFEKHLITPFNAKAMTLFPEKINGKFTAILSVDTDNPPAKISMIQFDKEEDMWNSQIWKKWYSEIEKYRIDPRRFDTDQVEIGAPPIKTKKGWLLIYSHIQNYFKKHKEGFYSEDVSFGVEAMLLDKNNPTKILGKSKGAIFSDGESYEKFGKVPNIVFPSGALIKKKDLEIFYGGADTVCCQAKVNLENLLASLLPGAMDKFVKRYDGNPILLLKPENAWENYAVFNPGAFQDGKIINIVYRSMSTDGTSFFGLATSRNGLKINSRLDHPIYSPRADFESKKQPGNSGCEDPRLTLLDGQIYMCYTAYDGVDLPRVALSHISLLDFRNQNWNWSEPVLISPNNVDDKDACIFPEKIDGKFLLIHRINGDICADFLHSPKSIEEATLLGTPIILPRPGMWDNEKVGLAAPPIKTKKGWLLLYHGISKSHHTYRVGAVLLDLKNPTLVIGRTSQPIFEPREKYELEGQVPKVVFPCGLAFIKDKLFIYYGGADSVVGVATASIKKLLSMFD
ncbi:MAG: hypothetical protein WCC74_02230 [Minisyncoccia bacterium]